MATEFIVNTAAHPNIYNGETRNFNLYYCIPEAGVTEATGIVLLIAGYGGMASSNVYKKMRLEFADKYNLITIQCDYFGSEFMQNEVSYSLDTRTFQQIPENEQAEFVQLFNTGKQAEVYNNLSSIATSYNFPIIGNACLSETVSNFNDMGLMQAIDNITAVYYVSKILKRENKNFNAKKIIAYGHSQGAYLSYLCNALVPDLFTLIVDNSDWVYPVYLQQQRELASNPDTKPQFIIYFKYLMSEMEKDQDLLNLIFLYELIPNYAKVIAFHGSNDDLILPRHKEGFCSLHGFDYRLITDTDVDEQIFKSTGHGLGADFLKLFDYALANLHGEFASSTTLKKNSHQIKTKKHVYQVGFKDDLPVVQVV